MLAELDASAVRRWCGAAADELASRRNEIDRLNVFPVPDGDTGTNLALTMRSAADAVENDASDSAAAVLRVMARGAVLGARGNSGVIVSQLLRGLSDTYASAAQAFAAQTFISPTGVDDVPAVADGSGVPAPKPPLREADTLVAGLRAAAAAAYAAVAQPVEGTILSVAEEAAVAAEQCARGDGTAGLAQVVQAAAVGARQALARTTGQLAVLAEAGVVDAGGLGLVVLLDALASIVTGQPQRTAADPAGPGLGASLETVRESGSAAFQYEVQFLLDGTAPDLERLKVQLSQLGDSLVVVGTGEGTSNVHVHVNDVGAALERAVEAGRPYRITVMRFADATSGVLAARGPALTAHGTVTSSPGTVIVAVAPGVGLADLFRSEGVTVVEGGPTSNPSTAEVLQEIVASGGARVVLLPNATAVRGVAEMAAEEARALGLTVAVVPTKSPVQGLAAVAIHDQARRFEDDVIAMAEAAAATRFAEVTVAVRDAITYAGRCSAGDVLGLIDGEVVEIGGTVDAVGINLVERLISAGGELITVLAGSDPGAEQACERVQRHVHERHPLVEITAFTGGQPHFPLLIGVE